MLEFLRAPFPFIIGLIWNEPTAESLYLENDIVVVDLDRDMIDLGDAFPAAFPHEIRESLLENLNQIGKPGFSRLDYALSGYFQGKPLEKNSSLEAIKFTCDHDTVYKRSIQIAFFKVSIYFYV